MDNELQEFMEKKSDQIEKIIRKLNELTGYGNISPFELRDVMLAFMQITLPEELFKKCYDKAHRRK